jgi:hypothetical protein
VVKERQGFYDIYNVQMRRRGELDPRKPDAGRAMKLKCLFRRHQWHNGWDDFEHQTVWTCKRCGKERREPVTHRSPREGAYHPR